MLRFNRSGRDSMIFPVIQMALIASAVAGTDGAYVAPTFEVGTQRKIIGQFISAQSAAELRSLMGLVVQSGTAAGAFASIDRGLTAGGKTGTADREMTEYDRDGNARCLHGQRGEPAYPANSGNRQLVHRICAGRQAANRICGDGGEGRGGRSVCYPDCGKAYRAGRSAWARDWNGRVRPGPKFTTPKRATSTMTLEWVQDYG